MMPNDIFQRGFDRTVGDIRTWALQRKCQAQFDEETTPTYWRASIQPAVAGACAAELILYRDQRFDVTIGSETYEGRRIENLGVFVPLLDAIAEGRAVTRRWTSQATGRGAVIETIVTLSHGAQWSDRRDLAAVAAQAGTQQKRDRYYVPYVRG